MIAALWLARCDKSRTFPQGETKIPTRAGGANGAEGFVWGHHRLRSGSDKEKSPEQGGSGAIGDARSGLIENQKTGNVRRCRSRTRVRVLLAVGQHHPIAAARWRRHTGWVALHGAA